MAPDLGDLLYFKGLAENAFKIFRGQKLKFKTNENENLHLHFDQKNEFKLSTKDRRLIKLFCLNYNELTATVNSYN